MSKVLIPLLFAAAMSMCVVGLTGCTTYGTVYVSHPQVFTRERLVVARDRELQFLSKQLDAPVTSNFQGAIDQRTLNAFQNSLALTVSPTAGAGTTAATSPTLSDTSGMMPGGAGSMDTAKNVGLSSEDQFDDIWAYRVKVNEVMRQEELDDTHDIDGNTLYTLKFDTALIPGDRSWRPALVKLTIQPEGLNNDLIKETYKLWIQQLNARRDADENGLDSRLYSGKLSSDDEIWVNYMYDGMKAFCNIVKYKIKDAQLQAAYLAYGQQAAIKAVNWMTETPEIRNKEIASFSNTNTEERDLLFTGMQMALNAKYSRDFAGLVSIDYDFNEYSTSNTVATCRLVPYNPILDTNSVWWSRSEWNSKRQMDGIVQFTELMKDWQPKAYVDSIDPPMYAQNISDVSSQTSLIQLALAINAAIGKPASLDETMKWTHETQKFLQAIKRQPLAVGFNSGSEFGWLLGAPYGINDSGDPEFRQMPVRQSFTVSIVVPAWAKLLTITGTQSWIDDDGTEIKGSNLLPYDVILPRDMSALISAAQYRLARIGPKIGLYGQSLQVDTNAQTLLIQGSDLWRNPAVFVNSTRADTVDLLPNMQGLLAHFSSIPQIDAGPADLTVVTSFGVDSIQKGVNVTSPLQPAITNAPPQAKLTNSFAVNGGQKLGFTLTGMPSAFAGFSIQLNTKGNPGKWQNIADTDCTYGTNSVSIAINPPAAAAPAAAPAAPTLYTIQLGLRLTPSATPINLIADTNNLPSFIYFSVKGQEQPVVTGVAIAYPSPAPAIALAALAPVTKANLYQAYPGFENAVTNNQVTLVLSQTATKIKSQPLPLTDTAGTGWTVPTAGLSATQLPSAVYDTFTLQYGNATPITISCAGGPVTVTGH